MIDFRAQADVRDGRVLLDADGELGGGDALEALVDADPDGDHFDLDLDYRAPAGGLLADADRRRGGRRARGSSATARWRRGTARFVVTQGGGEHRRVPAPQPRRAATASSARRGPEIT